MVMQMILPAKWTMIWLIRVMTSLRQDAQKARGLLKDPLRGPVHLRARLSGTEMLARQMEELWPEAQAFRESDANVGGDPPTPSLDSKYGSRPSGLIEGAAAFRPVRG